MSEVSVVADLLVDHVRGAHGVALVLAYGSHARGTQRPDSDFDVLFVVDEPEAVPLAVSFVLDGRPCDFWPVRWVFLENIANAHGGRPWGVAASLLADAKVLWARSDADEARLQELKERVASYSASSSAAATAELADIAYDDVVGALGLVHLASAGDDIQGARVAGWRLVKASLNVVALLERTYFTSSVGAYVAQAAQFSSAPEDLENLCRAVVEAHGTDSLAGAADRLAIAVGEEIRRRRSSDATPNENTFRDVYSEVHEHCIKITRACSEGDGLTASAEAHELEWEIASMFHRHRFGTNPGIAERSDALMRAYLDAGMPDLIGPAVEGNLAGLSQAATELDRQLADWLNARAIPVNDFASIDELRSVLSGIRAAYRC